MTGQALLWLVWNAAGDPSAAVDPTRHKQNSKVCMINACGGENMRSWLPLIEKN